MTITRPIYRSTALAAALHWHWQGWHLSRKMDGVWQQREISGSLLVGEAMRDGEFFAFDCPVAYGEDIRRRQWRERGEAMRQIAREAGVNTAPAGHGAEFIEAVLRDGGEGCVAKPLEGFFGVGWHKIKRVETFDATVTDKLRGAIAISYEGQDAGKCALSGRKFDAVSVGDVVEIAAMQRNVSGKFREPRFIRVRYDKILIQPQGDKARPV